MKISVNVVFLVSIFCVLLSVSCSDSSVEYDEHEFEKAQKIREQERNQYFNENKLKIQQQAELILKRIEDAKLIKEIGSIECQNSNSKPEVSFLFPGSNSEKTNALFVNVTKEKEAFLLGDVFDYENEIRLLTKTTNADSLTVSKTYLEGMLQVEYVFCFQETSFIPPLQLDEGVQKGVHQGEVIIMKIDSENPLCAFSTYSSNYDYIIDAGQDQSIEEIATSALKTNVVIKLENGIETFFILDSLGHEFQIYE